jgi:hypothetical protein
MNCPENTICVKDAGVISVIGVATLLFSFSAAAQTPGEWKYTISTDLQSVPEDMRVNFPTVSFKTCRSAEDFSSGRAFALQTLSSSEQRCPSTNFKRNAEGKNETIAFDFACDEGKTLSGRASGRVSAKQFELALTTSYPQPVSGVERIKQSMRAELVGACKAKPDADELKVP